MIELLTSYSLASILVIVVLVVLAIKEGVSLYEFFHTRISKRYEDKHKEQNERKNKEDDILTKLEEHIEHSKQLSEKYEELADSFSDFKEECRQNFIKQEERLDLLTISDMDDIRSWIVKEYHHYVEDQKWIDDFSLDTIEKRYAHYKSEGGNSYIHGLVHELRSLPKTPPRERY